MKHSIIILTAFVLCGCSANISIPSESSHSESALPAYIWHKGFGGTGSGWAVLQRISGESFDIQTKDVGVTDIRPGKYGSAMEWDGTAMQPGQYTATIELFVHVPCKNIIFVNPCYENVEVFTLPFAAREDRLYIPFADHKCGHNWRWIEDWGSAIENGAPSFRWLNNIINTSGINPMTGTTSVVAGEKPPDICP